MALRLNSQNLSQVTTAMDGHLPSIGWSPTSPMMDTQQPKDVQPSEAYYSHEILHLTLAQKTKAQQQLLMMVTYNH